MFSQLNINKYFIEELTIKKNPKFSKENSVEGEIFVDFDIYKNSNNPLVYKIPMIISVRAYPNSPYGIDTRIIGIFSYQEGTNRAYIEKTINLNAPSILYGIIRGVICEITANFENGKFILPAVNFIEILKNKVSKRKH